MAASRIHRFSLYFIIFCALLLAAPLSWFVLSGRNAVLHFVTLHVQRPYLDTILQSTILSESRYRWLRLFSLLLMAMIAMVATFLYRYRRYAFMAVFFAVRSVNGACRSFARVFVRSKRWENGVFVFLMVILAARGIYYITVTDLQYDEMWCYNYYTSRPVYLTLFSYANYSLYELATHFFKWLPFSIKVDLRLPSLISGLFACTLIYGCVKRLSGSFLTATATVVFFASTPLITNDMLYGKGMIEEIFFAIVSFFCLVFYLRKVRGAGWLFLYIISSVSGFYAMPTHVYYWFVQGVVSGFLIIGFKKNAFKPFFAVNGWVIVLVLACYLPIMIGSGMSPVVNAARGYDENYFPSTLLTAYLRDFSRYLSGGSYGMILVFVLAAVAMVIDSKKRVVYLSLLVFSMFLFLLPIPIRYFQRIEVPARALGFGVLGIPVAAYIIFDFLQRKTIPFVRSTIVSAGFLTMCMISHFHSFRTWSARSDRQAPVIANILMAHEVHTCYDNSQPSHFYYYYPALEFYFANRNRSIDLFINDPKSLRYRIFKPIDRYDCIIQHAPGSGESIGQGYYSVYTDLEEGFSIFIRNGK